MPAALTAGGIAATLAILLSLPLVSPHDGIFNAATVALAGLLITLLNAILWPLAAGRQNPPHISRYALLWLILALILTGTALYLMSASQLENYLPFTLTLAAVIFGVTALGTALFHRYIPQLPWWCAPILIAITLTLGWTLREIGDQPSGQLELPPPASRQLPPAPSTPSLTAPV